MLMKKLANMVSNYIYIVAKNHKTRIVRFIKTQNGHKTKDKINKDSIIGSIIYIFD